MRAHIVNSVATLTIQGNVNGSSLILPSSVGTIARAVEDCALFLKSVCVQKMWEMDPKVPPVPFDNKAYECGSKLRIGYFKSDGWFEPCKAARRGLEETIAQLEAAGHTCIPFQPPDDGRYRQQLYVFLFPWCIVNIVLGLIHVFLNFAVVRFTQVH